MLSLKIHYGFDLLLGDDFLSLYCEAIEDMIYGYAIYMVTLTSILFTNQISMTNFGLVLYFKIKYISFSR